MFSARRPPERWSHRGTTWGTELLGRGGFAEVYKGARTDPATGATIDVILISML